MTHNSLTKSTDQKQFFPEERIWRWLILGFLFTMALGIRIYGINEYPLDAHPVKQYRSAMIARAYYYEELASVPDWKRESAQLNRQRIGTLHPAIIYQIAAFAYSVAGAEYLWIPRLLSALFWLIGGWFLYLIALKITSADAALVTTAFYLFLPFGVRVSQSFQIDPLMVMMMIISLYSIIQFHQSPSKARSLVAGTISGIAILSKPVCLFIIFGAFIALAFDKKRSYRSILNLDSLIFIVMSLSFSTLFYGYEILFNGILQNQVQANSIEINLRNQAEVSFLPKLILDLSFWQFWLKHIHGVVGFSALVGALLGIMLLPPDWRRTMIVGSWVGYFVYGLVFTFHIHTHSYYQLPFVPIIALSLGPLGALILGHFTQANLRWPWRLSLGGIFLLAIFLNIGLIIRARQELPDFSKDVKVAEEIGQVVAHSNNTLFLAPYGGRPLQYHGELSGDLWPTRADMHVESLVGEPEVTMEARFHYLSSEIQPEYFIVTNLPEFDGQKELKGFLETNFPVVAEKQDEYIIFDLRTGIGTGSDK